MLDLLRKDGSTLYVILHSQQIRATQHPIAVLIYYCKCELHLLSKILMEYRAMYLVNEVFEVDPSRSYIVSKVQVKPLGHEVTPDAKVKLHLLDKRLLV